MARKNLISKGMRYLWDTDYRFRVNGVLGLYNSMPDDEYLTKQFQANMGEPLHLQ